MTTTTTTMMVMMTTMMTMVMIVVVVSPDVPDLEPRESRYQGLKLLTVFSYNTYRRPGHTATQLS